MRTSGQTSSVVHGREGDSSFRCSRAAPPTSTPTGAPPSGIPGGGNQEPTADTTTRTTLDTDTIYPGNGHAGGLLYLKYDKKHIARGVRARLTLGVAPDETNSGS
ncbi:hypothetical protein [Streptomyces sp. NPDC001450]